MKEGKGRGSNIQYIIILSILNFAYDSVTFYSTPIYASVKISYKNWSITFNCPTVGNYLTRGLTRVDSFSHITNFLTVSEIRQETRQVCNRTQVAIIFQRFPKVSLKLQNIKTSIVPKSTSITTTGTERGQIQKQVQVIQK